IGARPGKPRLPWSWRHWNGSRGSTTNACSNPSATFRPLRPKRDTIGNLQRRLWNLFYFNQTASAIPGVIHLGSKLLLPVIETGLRDAGFTAHSGHRLIVRRHRLSDDLVFEFCAVAGHCFTPSAPSNFQSDRADIYCDRGGRSAQTRQESILLGQVKQLWVPAMMALAVGIALQHDGARVVVQNRLRHSAQG